MSRELCLATPAQGSTFQMSVKTKQNKNQILENRQDKGLVSLIQRGAF